MDNVHWNEQATGMKAPKVLRYTGQIWFTCTRIQRYSVCTIHCMCVFLTLAVNMCFASILCRDCECRGKGPDSGEIMNGSWDRNLICVENGDCLSTSPENVSRERFHFENYCLWTHDSIRTPGQYFHYCPVYTWNVRRFLNVDAHSAMSLSFELVREYTSIYFGTRISRLLFETA